MRYFRIVVFSIVFFVLATFAYFNSGKTILVLFQYGGISYETISLPLFVFFFIAIFITILIMSVMGAFERTALRIKMRKIEKENKRLTEELEKAQAVPGKSQDVKQKGTESVPEEKGKRRGLFGGKEKTKTVATDEQ